VTPDELTWLRELRFAPSRIPKLDAIGTFVPTGTETDAVIAEAHSRTGFARWFPVDGGHKVIFPFEGGAYDSSRFQLEPEAWDHETCKVCRRHIPAMTLCWVTESGPYVILCDECHGKLEPENRA
jgi:hypothetical protein